MPFRRPTIQELKDRVATRFASEILDANGRPLGQLLKRGPLRVIANAVAGQSHELFGRLDEVARQAFPDTSDGVYLERYAFDRGVPRKAAAAARGEVELSGTLGAVVPAGTVLQRTDGRGFTIDVTATLVSSPQTFAVTAREAGLDSNVDAGDVLRFATPVSFVSSTATVLPDSAGRGLSGASTSRATPACSRASRRS